MKYSANLNKIDFEKYPGFVQTIHNMMNLSTYVTTGEYFMALYDEDLDELLEAVNKVTAAEAGQEDPVAVESILMLAIMLRTAEGSIDSSEEEMHNAFGLVCSYAALERLCRMGEVEVLHMNMSLDIDSLSGMRKIARKI